MKVCMFEVGQYNSISIDGEKTFNIPPNCCSSWGQLKPCMYICVCKCMYACKCVSLRKKSVGFFRSEDEIDTGDLNHGGLMIWDFVHKLPPTKVEGKQPPNSFTHKTSQRPTEYLQLIPETIIEGSPHNKKSPYERNYLARMSWKVSVGVVPSFLLVISYHIPCIPIA